MRFKPTLIQFALVTLCVAAHIQEAIASPTDTELKAAYCFAVKKRQVDMARDGVSMMESMHADSGRARKALADANDQLERLRAYVVPKMMDDDNTALAAAFARGQHDVAQLDSPELLQCGPKCGVPNAASAADMQRYNACLVSCAPELIPRLRSCNDLSWLPF